MSPRILLMSAATLAFTGAAIGANVTYFGEDLTPGGSLAGMTNSQAARSNFLSGLVGVGTENFEGFAANQSIPPPAVVSFGIAGNALLNSTSGTSFIRAAPGAGRFATSGQKYLETDAGGDFVIDFTNPGGVAAFGFYGTDIGDFGNALSLRFTRVDNSTYTINVGNSTGFEGSGLFFGIIADLSDQFIRVEFLNNPGGVDIFGFDDMTVGSREQVIPLPPAAYTGMALMAGIGAVGYIRRRRSS